MQVLGQTIQIVARKPKKDSHGEFFPLEHRIELNNNLKEGAYRRTRDHEIFHAFLKMTGKDQLLSEDMQEALCSAFEGFADDLRRLFEEEKE